MKKLLASTLAFTGLALAQTTGGPDFSSINPDISAVFPLAVGIVGALIAMIPVRKAIKLVNRS